MLTAFKYDANNTHTRYATRVDNVYTVTSDVDTRVAHTASRSYFRHVPLASKNWAIESLSGGSLSTFRSNEDRTRVRIARGDPASEYSLRRFLQHL